MTIYEKIILAMLIILLFSFFGAVILFVIDDTINYVDYYGEDEDD